jgi:hypothetical protein
MSYEKFSVTISSAGKAEEIVTENFLFENLNVQ